MLALRPDLARSAFDSAPDTMIIIGSSGIIRATNRQGSAIFGYSHEEPIGHPEHLIPERSRGRHHADRESYACNPRLRPVGAGVDPLGRRKDSTEFPVEVSLSPIEVKAGLLIAAAIRGISDRQRIEAERVQARRAAEAAREAVDGANQAKSRFLATASLRSGVAPQAGHDSCHRRMTRSS